MNRLTCFFMIFLRLAIGWHFLFEGLEKLQSYRTTGKPAFTSEAFLRESPAPGQLGKFFHWLPGDPVLERYAVLPAEEGKENTDSQRLTVALQKDWRGYFDAFVKYY